MNSKERVLSYIRREPTDSVPLGFYLVDHDIISKVIGRPTYVRNKIGLQKAYWEGRRDEVVESMKADIVDFYEKMDLCDIITYMEACEVPPKGYMPSPPKKLSDEEYEDSAGRIFKLSKISDEFVCVKDPTSKTRQYTLEEFLEPAEKLEKPLDPSTLEVYNHVVSHFKNTRYVAGLTGGLASIFILLGGMEQGLMEYIENPEMVKAASRQMTGRLNIRDPYYMMPGLGGAFLSCDLSSTNGPLISPQMFREFSLPSFKARIENIRRLQPGIQILFHSCGNSRPIIKDFIEAGVQVYQSLQSIPEMWVGDLKKDFGEDLIFWGGVPVEELVGGTAEDVRKSVRRAMAVAAKGGGVILGPSHSIAFGTKYENFMAMLDEFDKLRFCIREI